MLRSFAIDLERGVRIDTSNFIRPDAFERFREKLQTVLSNCTENTYGVRKIWQEDERSVLIKIGRFDKQTVIAITRDTVEELHNEDADRVIQEILHKLQQPEHWLGGRLAGDPDPDFSIDQDGNIELLRGPDDGSKNE